MFSIASPRELSPIRNPKRSLIPEESDLLDLHSPDTNDVKDFGSFPNEEVVAGSTPKPSVVASLWDSFGNDLDVFHLGPDPAGPPASEIASAFRIEKEPYIKISNPASISHDQPGLQSHPGYIHTATGRAHNGTTSPPSLPLGRILNPVPAGTLDTRRSPLGGPPGEQFCISGGVRHSVLTNGPFGVSNFESSSEHEMPSGQW